MEDKGWRVAGANDTTRAIVASISEAFGSDPTKLTGEELQTAVLNVQNYLDNYNDINRRSDYQKAGLDVVEVTR